MTRHWDIDAFLVSYGLEPLTPLDYRRGLIAEDLNAIVAANGGDPGPWARFIIDEPTPRGFSATIAIIDEET